MNDFNNSEEEETANWSESYSDVMSLLLTFFIVLTSMSQINQKKFESVRSEFNKKYRLQSDFAPEVNSARGEIITKPQKKARRINRKLKSHVRSVRGKGKSSLEIIFKQGIFFEPGSVELKPSADKILQKAVKAVSSQYKQYKIRVKSFALKSEMKNSTFSSEWELSAGRSMVMVRRLLAGGIKPGRISYIGDMATASKKNTHKSVSLTVFE